MGDNSLLEALAMAATFGVASHFYYQNYIKKLLRKNKESLSEFQKKILNFYERAVEKRDLWLTDYVVRPLEELADKCSEKYEDSGALLRALADRHLKGYENSKLLHNLADKSSEIYERLGKKISSSGAYKRMEQVKEKAERPAKKVVNYIDWFLKL